jgi:hypothetical protein
MRQILHDVEQSLYTLEIRSDEPEVIHTQLEHCLVSYFEFFSSSYSIILFS